MSFWQITDNLEKKSKLVAKKEFIKLAVKGLFLGNWSDYNKSQKYFDTVSKIDGTRSSIFCQEWIQSSAELNTQSSVERWRHIIQQHQLSATAPYFFDRAQNIVCCGMEFFHYSSIPLWCKTWGPRTSESTGCLWSSCCFNVMTWVRSKSIETTHSL